MLWLFALGSGCGFAMAFALCFGCGFAMAFAMDEGYDYVKW